VHLAGGRLAAGPIVPSESYSIEMWFWNGLPNDARQVTGYLFARSSHGGPVETLGLGGSSGAAGRLFVSRSGSPPLVTGKTEIGPRTWHHIVLSRNGGRVAVHLDGNPDAEIAGDLSPDVETTLSTMTVGGRVDHEATFEGKIAEVALYDRPLTATEIVEHFRAARVTAGQPDR
jgi:hypothetical protein